MVQPVQFDLVSPERRLASLEATEVQIPGADGDMTAMADHAPTITTLRPGVLRVVSGSGAEEYLVTGGFAEISPTGVSVLAEKAVAKTDVSQDELSAMIAAATEAKANAAADGVDAADKYLADLKAVAAEMGIAV